MNWLKGKPLWLQIWVMIGGVFGISFVLFAVISSFVLKNISISDSYEKIEKEQQMYIEYDKLNFYFYSEKVFYSKINHAFIGDSGTILPNEASLNKIIDVIEGSLEEKKYNMKNGRYSANINNKKILYVIQRFEINQEEGYVVSYLWSDYNGNLFEKTFFKIIDVLIFVFLTSWIASIFIAQYLIHPLTKLKKQVKEIAYRNWDHPILLDRDDEIGELGEAIEFMRCQIKDYHQKQQSFIQQVSHELKTPIMVIRGYINSILEGLFSEGNLVKPLEVIEGETERLEKKVHSLINISKLEYIDRDNYYKEKCDLGILLKECIKKFGWRKTELCWEINLTEKPLYIFADQDKLKIALENIFDNQVRYAENLIRINEITKDCDDDIKKALGLDGNFKNNSILVQIFNDGPPISKKTKDNLFSKFNKSEDGNFGLGLAIVKTIIDRHNGSIWAVNESQGVSFYLKLPAASNSHHPEG